MKSNDIVGNDVTVSKSGFTELLVIVIVMSLCFLLLVILILVKCYVKKAVKKKQEKLQKEKDSKTDLTPKPSIIIPTTPRRSSIKSNGTDIRYKAGTPIVFDDEIERQPSPLWSETSLAGTLDTERPVSRLSSRGDESYIVTNGTLPRMPVSPVLDRLRPPPPPYARKNTPI